MHVNSTNNAIMLLQHAACLSCMRVDVASYIPAVPILARLTPSSFFHLLYPTLLITFELACIVAAASQRIDAPLDCIAFALLICFFFHLVANVYLGCKFTWGVIWALTAGPAPSRGGTNLRMGL